MIRTAETVTQVVRSRARSDRKLCSCPIPAEPVTSNASPSARTVYALGFGEARATRKRQV